MRAPRRSNGPTARDLGLVLLFGSAVGVMLFLYRYLDVVATGGDRPVLDPLLCEMTGALGSALLFLAVRGVARRWPLDRPGGYRRIPVHLLGVVLFGATATSWMWASRSVLFPLTGLGPYDYGRMPHRYFMEFPVQFLAYALMVAGVTLADRFRSEREWALRAAQLETQLSRSRLTALELQLQPHFLFNALNTISSVMYEDPQAADEMIGHLAELLRLSLRGDRRSEVTLREEITALDHYLSVMRARFGDGLEVAVEVEESALDVAVPSLVLQPLVENAVRHGGAEAVGRGRVRVRAAREGTELRIEVHDEGPSASGREGTGLGLALTRERLRLLYGDRHTFDASGIPGGGFRVTMTLPARVLAGTAAAAEAVAPMER
jgi:signal transduction histidine kinase